MSVQNSVKSRQSPAVEFNDMASIAALASILDRRVRVEAADHGVKPETAIEIVARQFKASAGTISNILRCKKGKARVKSVCFILASRIINSAISDIEREQQQLDERRAGLERLAINPNPAALARAEEGLRITREALLEMGAAR